jgi:hypothetical protein
MVRSGVRSASLHVHRALRTRAGVAAALAGLVATVALPAARRSRIPAAR